MTKKKLIYQINSARHAMMKSLDSECRRQLNISVVQLSALMVLNEKGNCRMKDLADILMLDKSAVTGLADRMRAAGLVEKVKSGEDSRVTMLTITELGKDMVKTGSAHLKMTNEKITQGFTEEEIETVSRFLAHISTVFSSSSPATGAAGEETAHD